MRMGIATVKFTMLSGRSNQFDPDPVSMLLRYSCGHMPMAVEGTEVTWVRPSHRGVQFLDRIDFPRKEKRYIFSPKFKIQYDTDFEGTLRGCAGEDRPGGSWISGDLFKGYMNLHRLGFAHSYEAWCDGQLAGGAIGVQIGGYISCESMFHRVSNASKAAWGQTLEWLKARGFAWIDTNIVAAHHVNYGEEWVPQWKFEKMMREATAQTISLADHIPCPSLPWGYRWRLPLMRGFETVARKIGSRTGRAVASPAT